MSTDANKGKLKNTRKQQGQRDLNSPPIPPEDLRDLIDYLDRPNQPACDHTLRVTIEFLKQRNLDVERAVVWLNEHGGYCDCEVILNVDDNF
jgi:hypothetical protein